MLPVKKNTIVECIFDIFYDTSVLSSLEHILSKILVDTEYKNIKKLSLCELPEGIRKQEPNLRYETLYELTAQENNEYKILLGDNKLGIAIKDKYTSWSNSFYKKIQKIMPSALLNMQCSVKRVGLRYVDFFENEDIFETGAITAKANNIANERVFIRLDGEDDDLMYHKTITNKTSYKENKNGSIVDIVTFKQGNIKLDDICMQAGKLHTLQKQKFKEIIGEEYASKYGF